MIVNSIIQSISEPNKFNKSSRQAPCSLSLKSKNMKTASCLSTAVLLIACVLAGEIHHREMDMEVPFPLFPRASLTNLMVPPLPIPLPTPICPSTSTSNSPPQTFTGALGGAAADPITNSGNSARPFEVSGSTFTDLTSAWTRSCNNQHNACADIANGSKSAGVTTGECDTQQSMSLRL